MKNIHLLSTSKPGQILRAKSNGNLFLNPISNNWDTQYWDWPNIYITSDETIVQMDWYLDDTLLLRRALPTETDWKNSGKPGYIQCEKIILTTDPDLIANGVQEIDETFLEWFVANKNCEYVEWSSEKIDGSYDGTSWKYKYGTVIPKTKPETLEDAALLNCESLTHPYCDREKSMFIKGANWQKERSYDETEAGELVYNIVGELAMHHNIIIDGAKLNDLFKEFKKK